MSDNIEEDDTFLRTEPDNLKEQIKLLEERLSRATEKQRKLKKELLEEDISYLVTSNLTNVFTDPTVATKTEFSSAKQEIFRQMRESVKASCIHEMISYHRLSGRTMYHFKKHHIGVRLETFYKNRYKEPYYILFLKNNLKEVDIDTIPAFIPKKKLEKKFLPDNFETFIRIIHDCVQAYVSRREKINEIAEMSKEYNVKIMSENMSKTAIKIRAQMKDNMESVLISLQFENKISAYPTQVKITDERGIVSLSEYQELEETLMRNIDLVDILQNLLAKKDEQQELMDIVENE